MIREADCAKCRCKVIVVDILVKANKNRLGPSVNTINRVDERLLVTLSVIQIVYFREMNRAKFAVILDYLSIAIRSICDSVNFFHDIRCLRVDFVKYCSACILTARQ